FDRADKDSKDLNGRQNGQRPTAAICNGWMKCKYRVLSSLLRLVTVDNNAFKSQPLQIAKRYAQCRADKVVATAHWHICLPHIPSRHQSKQKSQFLPPQTKRNEIY